MTLPSFLRLGLRLLLPAAILCTPALAAPPVAPLITSITWNASNSFNATWQDRSNNEGGFWLVYRTTTSGNFTKLGERGANLTSITFTPDSTFRVCGVIFEWAIVAWKGTAGNEEYSFSPTTVELLAPPPTGTSQCPPVFRTTDYTSGSLNLPFSLQATAYKRNNSTGALVALTSGITATGLPPGMTISSSGSITGAATAVGKYTVTLKAQETSGPPGTKTLKLAIFRPVPVKVAPATDMPLADHALQGNGAPVLVDLNTHFNDPDVTEASRLVFNMGTIDFLYYSTAAPVTVANFKGYISRGDFVNTIIHRSIPGFVLQGGGYKAEAGTPSITRQPLPVINEPEITNGTGTVAMAKSGGSPNSATSEFFISLADNSLNLNNQNEGFAVFARVPDSGMAVASTIATLCIFDYTAINGVLSDCPLIPPASCLPGEPTPPFDPAALVKMISAGPVEPLSYTVQSSDPLVCEAAVLATQLTLTPLAGGTATITVTATDLDNQAISRPFNVTVTVSNQLAAWLVAQNFPNPADATASANPDGDSGQNIMEFALMTDPQSATPVPAPQAGLTTVGGSQYLTLAFPVRKQAGSSFLYTVESQDGLSGAWTPVWTSANGFAHAQVASSTDLPDRTNVTIRDTAAITAGAPRFVRLRVTDTP